MMSKSSHFNKQDLFKVLPMFGRDSLDTVYKFHELAGNPACKYKTIHVAGTNGKGSVCHHIAEALILGCKLNNHEELKIAKYTSPHILEFNERISINGENIGDEDLERITYELLEIAKNPEHELKVVSFDLITMIAFKYFAEQKVDYAVIEVGLGGIYDSTNIIKPEITIITSIGYDHINILGDTLEKISEAKMGICKQNVPILIGPDWPTEHMIDYITNNLGLDNNLIHTIKNNDTKDIKNYYLENSLISTNALEILRDSGDEILAQILTDDIINKATQTFPKARLELLFSSDNVNISESYEGVKSVYFDAGHNTNGISKTIDTLMNKFEWKSKLLIVCSFAKSENIYKNILAMTEHSQCDNIDSIILVANNAEDKMSYHTDELNIKSLIESIEGIDSHDKIKFFDPETETLMTYNSGSEIWEDSGSLTLTLNHLHNNKEYENMECLIIGTFRIYSQVNEYYKNKFN